MLSRVLLLGVLLAMGAFLIAVSPGKIALGSERAQAKQASESVKDLAPKRFTFTQKDVLLSKALAELSRQTGNEVEDRRQAKEDVKINLDLKNVTFWQGLDAIAKAADLKVSLFERDNKVALTEGPHLLLPVSYDGLFRVAIKRLQILHILEQDSKQCIMTLEVAWEPRFQPLFIETQPEELVLTDDKGRNVDPPEENKGTAALGKGPAKEIIVRCNAPQRSANQLKLFKGKLTVLGPSKVLTFTFDKLSEIKQRKDAQKATQDGVTVHLQELRNEGQAGDAVWTVGLLLEYPADGPKFESFQSWIVNNEIFLAKEKGGLRQQFPPNLGYETDDQSENKAIIRYRFGDEPEKKLILGKFGDWTLTYKTPGKVAEIPIAFEFKDVPLP